MQEEVPSRTAYRVALRRAAHQVFDDPVVFRDRFALPILGLSADRLGPTDLRAPNRPTSRSLRAFLVARSLFAEEALAAATAQDGPVQYVLLGAGLDTFALRRPHANVRVFEVDHPATQAWKQRLLRDAGLSADSIAVAVNFETDDLEQRLGAAGLDATKPAVFAMLGVVPYLTAEAFAATLEMLQRRTGRTWLAMDYGLPRHALPQDEQLALDSLAARVAQAGEPFRLFFTPEAIGERMKDAGFQVVEHLSPEEINARYFAGRGSTLRLVGTGVRLLLVVREGGALFRRGPAGAESEHAGQHEHGEEGNTDGEILHEDNSLRRRGIGETGPADALSIRRVAWV